MVRIAVGTKILDDALFYLDEENRIQNVSVHSFATGKKVVIFGVPRAFTPVCSWEHIPGFVESTKSLKAKGMDDIICISVNDPFVMKEWENSYTENKHIKIFLMALRITHIYWALNYI
jgi:peroxiredoxin